MKFLSGIKSATCIFTAYIQKKKQKAEAFLSSLNRPTKNGTAFIFLLLAVLVCVDCFVEIPKKGNEIYFNLAIGTITIYAVILFALLISIIESGRSSESKDTIRVLLWSSWIYPLSIAEIFIALSLLRGWFGVVTVLFLGMLGFALIYSIYKVIIILINRSLFQERRSELVASLLVEYSEKAKSGNGDYCGMLKEEIASLRDDLESCIRQGSTLAVEEYITIFIKMFQCLLRYEPTDGTLQGLDVHPLVYSYSKSAYNTKMPTTLLMSFVENEIQSICECAAVSNKSEIIVRILNLLKEITILSLREKNLALVHASLNCFPFMYECTATVGNDRTNEFLCVRSVRILNSLYDQMKKEQNGRERVVTENFEILVFKSFENRRIEDLSRLLNHESIFINSKSGYCPRIKFNMFTWLVIKRKDYSIKEMLPYFRLVRPSNLDIPICAYNECGAPYIMKYMQPFMWEAPKELESEPSPLNWKAISLIIQVLLLFCQDYQPEDKELQALKDIGRLDGEKFRKVIDKKCIQELTQEILGQDYVNLNRIIKEIGSLKHLLGIEN